MSGPPVKKFSQDAPVRGNDAERKFGSAVLVMAIIGGAVLTAAMGATSDVAGIAHAMLVPAACFVIILLFASRHWTGTRRMGR